MSRSFFTERRRPNCQQGNIIPAPTLKRDAPLEVDHTIVQTTSRAYFSISDERLYSYFSLNLGTAILIQCGRRGYHLSTILLWCDEPTHGIRRWQLGSTRGGIVYHHLAWRDASEQENIEYPFEKTFRKVVLADNQKNVE